MTWSRGGRSGVDLRQAALRCLCNYGNCASLGQKVAASISANRATANSWKKSGRPSIEHSHSEPSRFSLN